MKYCHYAMYISSALLVDRLKQEVKEKDAELKQERERLVELSRAESQLSARLQGEAERARDVESSVAELKEQLAASAARCQELESSKSSLEEQLRAEEARHQESLQKVQSELHQERERSSEFALEIAQLNGSLEAEGIKVTAALTTGADLQQRMEQAQAEACKRSESWNLEKVKLDDQLSKAESERASAVATSAALTSEVKVLREAVASGEDRVARLEVALKQAQQEGAAQQQVLAAEVAQLQAGVGSSGGLEAQLAKATLETKSLKAELAEKGVLQRENLVELNDRAAR